MPPGGLAGVCAVIFFVSAATSNKVMTKTQKYLFTLVSSKRESVTRPVSKAFNDSNVTDDEFRNGSKP